MSCHIHGDNECSCPAYLVTMGDMDAMLEREMQETICPRCLTTHNTPALGMPWHQTVPGERFCFVCGPKGEGYFLPDAPPFDSRGLA